MDRVIRFILLRRLRDRASLSRMGIVMLYLIALTAVLPRQGVLMPDVEAGRVWNHSDLVAGMDFPVHRSPALWKALCDSTRAQVLPVYRADTTAREKTLHDFQAHLGASYEQLRSYRQTGLEKGRPGHTGRDYFIAYQLRMADFPADTSARHPQWLQDLNQRGVRWLSDLYRQGYMGQRGDSSRHAFFELVLNKGLRRRMPFSKYLLRTDAEQMLLRQAADLPQAQAKLLVSLVLESLVPAVRYDPVETRRQQQQALQWVSNVSIIVKKGELLLQKGQLITEKARDKALAYNLALAETRSFRNHFQFLLSQFLIVLLITAQLLIYLGVNKAQVFYDNRNLGLILTVLLLGVISMRLAFESSAIFSDEFQISPIYLAPACIVPMLMLNFYETRTGFMTNLIIALYGGFLLGGGMEYVFIQLMAGSVAVYNLRRLRERRVFFYTLGYVFVAYIAAYIAWALFINADLAHGALQPQQFTVFLFNVALTMLSYPMIYALERAFGVVSDLTYLELLDTNRTLLKKLARKAPGTFHHSLNVASMAEAVVQQIGGNALLIHVGALYHDIGKAEHAHIFIENVGLEDSPHRFMSCEESAAAIMRHVPEGVQLAERYKLPHTVIDFIKTHHGTTRVEFFYRQFLQETGRKSCDPAEEARFRYPGPLPTTKEMAVLMLADSIEAASRSLKDPSEEDLEQLVNNVIDYKVKEGQLEKSTLTFKDLVAIRKIIYKQLLSMYRGRIRYPEAPPAPAAPQPVTPL